MLKVGDTVAVTEDTACAYNRCRIPKGLLTRVKEVEGDLIQIEYELADYDHAYVKAKLLKPAKAPTMNDLFNEIYTGILSGGGWYITLSKSLTEEYSEYLDGDEESDDFHKYLTPQILSHVFMSLPYEKKIMSIKNMSPDLGNHYFYNAIRDFIFHPMNRESLESLKRR